MIRPAELRDDNQDMSIALDECAQATVEVASRVESLTKVEPLNNSGETIIMITHVGAADVVGSPPDPLGMPTVTLAAGGVAQVLPRIALG